MVLRLRPHVRERKGRGGRRERQRRDCVQRGEEARSEPRKREQVLVHVHEAPAGACIREQPTCACVYVRQRQVV
jgi:hypothetical protein